MSEEFGPQSGHIAVTTYAATLAAAIPQTMLRVKRDRPEPITVECSVQQEVAGVVADHVGRLTWGIRGGFHTADFDIGRGSRVTVVADELSLQALSVGTVAAANVATIRATASPAFGPGSDRAIRTISVAAALGGGTGTLTIPAFAKRVQFAIDIISNTPTMTMRDASGTGITILTYTNTTRVDQWIPSTARDVLVTNPAASNLVCRAVFQLDLGA